MITPTQLWIFVIVGAVIVATGGVSFGISSLVGLHLETMINRITRYRFEKQTHDDAVRGRNQGLKEYERRIFKFLMYAMWIPGLNLIMLVLLWILGFILGGLTAFIESYKSTGRLRELVKKPRR